MGTKSHQTCTIRLRATLISNNVLMKRSKTQHNAVYQSLPIIGILPTLELKPYKYRKNKNNSCRGNLIMQLNGT